MGRKLNKALEIERGSMNDRELDDNSCCRDSYIAYVGNFSDIQFAVQTIQNSCFCLLPAFTSCISIPFMIS